MRKYFALLGMLLLAPGAAHGYPIIATASSSQRILQDPESKVIYYLESDLRHIAALSPDGKLLWCCEVIPPTMERRVVVIQFSLRYKDSTFLDVASNNAGPTYGVIDKKSGVYTFRGAD